MRKKTKEKSHNASRSWRWLFKWVALHVWLCWPMRWPCVPVSQVFYSSTLLQETNWSNGRWEWVEMETVITSSFCQEIRNAISSSPPWQTTGPWTLLLLPECSGERFAQPLPLLGSCLEVQSCKSLLETCVLVVRVFLLPMWKSSIGMGLYAEKWYS